ncbi:glycosyl transferase [Nocardioides psychrotolerans]|uniref:Glycosyltransferase involved in cell wall bisynthesis n=1 Tax=Nocardioides psychrotolerans TaxID=1005945 RepID=A0A1I3N647_9ACTN|nr:glycosyltransferase [Nocardioides psychrotolerans]GEP40447.1 glycosyl transferase [Nocardioides psychrotolerans]SFJ04677.1 Glycosyltransferase involved in cell wall bisynthesis [Nocardioides psychrotolerans]
MRVLVASKFLHHVGGVETYISWLGRHLEREGHELAFFGMNPPDGDRVMPDLQGPLFLSPSRDYYGSVATKVRSAATSIYSFSAARVMEEALDAFRPDVVHFQSTCYQLTPSVVRAATRRAVPTLTTAHEYKFVCSNQRLWDDGRGQPCVKCVDATTSQRVRSIIETQCVKGSLASSIVAAAELPVSNGVWRRNSGIVHAPSHFMADLLEGRGSPVRGRVRYLDLSWGDTAHLPGSHRPDRQDVTYIGRLSVEKGVDTLIHAWPHVSRHRPDARLKLYGSGADEPRLREAALGVERVEFCGRYERESLTEILASSIVTVHPSKWAENSPYTVRESLQHGVPAIVSDQGGLPEMVEAATGAVFPAGDVDGLAQAITREIDSGRAGQPDLLDAVARRFVTDAQHLSRLEELYGEAQDLCAASR